MSHIVDKVFYSDHGYSSTVVSKRGSKYNVFDNRMERLSDYELSDMLKAEKAFVALNKNLLKMPVGNVLGVAQVKPDDRSAVIFFKDKTADYYLNNFMTFHLQKGTVFNVPINRMRLVTGTPLTRLKHNDFVDGLSVKDFVKIVSKYTSYIEKQCKVNGVKFRDDIVHLSLVGLNGRFVFDVKLWDDFLNADLSPSEVAFALSKELNPLWQNGTLNVTPEVAKGLSSVPAEWVRNLFIN